MFDVIVVCHGLLLYGFLVFLVYARGPAIRHNGKVGEDFSHDLLAPSSSLPASHTGVIMCQPGRKPFWNSTERDLASEDSAKLVAVAFSLLTEISNLRTPSEEISVAGVVLSNTCIDQRLQGHLFSLPATLNFNLPLA